MQYSIIQALKYVFQIIGSIIFEQFFQNSEPRHTIFYSIFIFIIMDIMNYMFAARMNLEIGISDFIFEFIQIGILNTLGNTILYLNIFSFIAKLMPDNYEGSVFAFISSANMFTYWVVSTLFAVFINNELMPDPVT
jgi:MFS-type transporter involved in bile tolerance (Atg22 family)